MSFFKLRVCLFAAIAFCCSALAHKPLLSVDDNEDGTIYVEVGFSDGSSGAGHDIILKDTSGKEISSAKVPDESSLDMPMPSVPYTVTFSAGEGHIVTVDGPFSEASASAGKAGEEKVVEVETAEAAPAAAQAQKPAVPAVQPAGVVVSPQPQVMVGTMPSMSASPGFSMALQMLLITAIIIAVAVAGVLVMLSFGIGYSIGKSRK